MATVSLSRRSLADQVADALVQLILEEGLQEGDSLPSTAELSERFDVSRTVVREALAALAGRGILSRSQGRECVVATPGPDELNRLLQFRIRHDEVGVDDILDTRMALEVTAARRAAENVTPAAVADLRRCFDELAGAKSEKEFHQADIALHRAVAEASGNPLLVLILDALVDFLRDVRVQATKNRKGRGENLEAVIEHHRAIVDAVAAGDGVAAEAAMVAHLGQTRAEFSQPASAKRKKA